MEGDKLYRYQVPGDVECPSCGTPYGILFILAETKEEADGVRVNGGGLCGECMCNVIIDTHGYITTQKEQVRR